MKLATLDIDSELTYDPDDGSLEPEGPTRRYGSELSNYCKVNDFLNLDGDVSWDNARFTDNEGSLGTYVPEALQTMASAGAEVHDLDDWFSELRLRYFGPRPLTQNGTVRSNASTVWNYKLGRKLTKNLTVSLDVFNLFDSKADDIEYYYASRLPGEPVAGVNDIHFHPTEPRQFQVSLIAKLF